MNIYILQSVHVRLYSVPSVLLIIFTYCSQSMWASTLSRAIVFTEVIVQWVQKVKLNVIVWKDSLENDATVSQTLFSKPFLFVIPSWSITSETLQERGDFEQINWTFCDIHCFRYITIYYIREPECFKWRHHLSRICKCLFDQIAQVGK